MRTRLITIASILIAGMVIMVGIYIFSGRMANGAENDFREICDATNSTFTKAGGKWLCVRDGEVVYPK
jgi:hypothetical protein